MFPITIKPELTEKLPSLTLGCLEAKVSIAPSSEELINWIEKQLDHIKVSLTPETIRQMGTVKATKDAYRALGKDPNRYRPAAESLMRRIANGKELYQISNTVDVLNYISIKTGYSICGYDADLIKGEVSMGIGDTNEPYEGIGRGTVNIEQLPVFRDTDGAFGTPTSDSTRTMITEKTENILFIFIGFEGKDELEGALAETAALLKEHAKASELTTYFI
ncbi:B3/B4 domain-containing protein [Plebeiibacterium marinum]|uniref:Phenylalanine--tRNA ligase beta subunit-related protein n=1 Tax=Plebeiibacterium marinum TaxID=2992111 RepID=A0AAE3MHN8_9BACT|nr:phenylalanine--tRNA ligase beta subunit-related protein [Plebeiobacterium marinum]MCW3807816.1 phenylalanine--tRNA ligase beta subunit-related protein [Plebeiobacterium marinum]